MEITKIRLKNNAASLMGVVTILLIVMVAFFAGFAWIQGNASQAGLTVDSKYNDSYEGLVDSQTDLDTKVTQIQTNFGDISEADDIWQVAWNGLKGLGNVLTLPIQFVGTALSVWEVLIPGLGFLPDWVETLIFIGITAFIVLLVLSILKGDPKLIE